MKPVFNVDMREVTRLTREGRLDEAMALLRGGAPDTDDTPEASWAPADTTPRTRLGFALPSAADMISPAGLMARLGTLDFDAQPQGGTPVEGAAQFENRSFANAAGNRAYKLFIPSCYADAPLPLVVMLHGCSQSPDDFAIGTQMNEFAEERGFFVAYPGQNKSANASRCWNWFNSGDQQRGQGEPSIIAGITREIMAEFSIQPDRVFIAGLSAGGATAAIMGAAYPDLYAAIGVHSGLACGAARDMSSAFGAMRDGGSGTPTRSADGRIVPTIVFHGDRDTTVNPINGDFVIAQSKADARLRTDVTQGAAPGGMRYTRTRESDESGRVVLEQWVVHGSGHAWSGGNPDGSFTDPRGPDASREMVRFFLDETSA